MGKSISIQAISRTKIEREQSGNRKRQSGNDVVRSDIRHVQKENEVLRRVNDILEKGYDIVKRDNDNLRKGIEDVRKENDNLRSDIDALRQSIEVKKKSNDDEAELQRQRQERNDSIQRERENDEEIMDMIDERLEKKKSEKVRSGIFTLIMHFKKRKSMTVKQMRELTRLSPATISRYISIMKKENWISFFGYPKDGFFVLDGNLRWKLDNPDVPFTGTKEQREIMNKYFVSSYYK